MTVPTELRTAFAKISNWDKIAQRYGVANPFTVGKIYTPLEADFVIMMMNEESIYQKEQTKR